MGAELLKDLVDAMLRYDTAQSEKPAKQIVESGTDPLDIIDKALRPTLDRLGKDFENYKVGLPELVVAGDIAMAVSSIVEEGLVSGKEIPVKGKVAIGTVKGDIHSIGKNIVCVMMRAYGFKVLDLGADVSPNEFLKAAEGVDAIGLSGLLTLATRSMKETIDKVMAQHPGKIIIAGGAAMDPGLAEKLGVLYGPDATAGVRILEDELGKRAAS